MSAPLSVPGATPGARPAGSPGARLFVPLGLGLAALLVGTAFGWNGGLLDGLVAPPALVRAMLVGVCGWLGVALLRQALLGLTDAGENIPVLVRGVRYIFLAVAAFAAGVGWLLASPLPLIAALLIAGVDVVETSFLLIVMGARRIASSG